jgi:DNA replication protein DnaC
LLLDDLAVARETGNLHALRTQLAKVKLLILDDWGIGSMSQRGRKDLLEIIDDRINAGSVIITAQLPIDTWHAYLGEPTIADAILDRIVHSAHRIELQGESMRKLKSTQL